MYVQGLEQELRAVEPEVALTISKGDSLVFKISKVDIPKANQIRAALDLLRSDWLQLKNRAEVTKTIYFHMLLFFSRVLSAFNFVSGKLND